MKRCNRCGETKPLEAFHVNRGHRDGRQGHCAACNSRLREFYPDAFRAASARRRARKSGAAAEKFSRGQLLEHYASLSVGPDGTPICIYCLGPYEHDDHAVPLKRGGRHARANLVPACARCNLSKSSASLSTWAPWITDYLRVAGIDVEETAAA